MKAIVYEKYGPPEVLRLAEVPTPQPKDHEIRVKIMATTVNRTDCGFSRVEYVAVRVVGGFFKPRNKILGSEFAGVVDQVGKDVTKFLVGDRVFGLKTFRFGTHAEYVCLGENASVAPMPAKVSFAEAAAVCDGLMLAHNYVGKMSIDKNFRLLVSGGSGSIGSAAVQLAAGSGALVAEPPFGLGDPSVWRAPGGLSHPH